MPGADKLSDAPRLHEAARQLFGGVASEPTHLYVNVTAPMPRVDAGHVDVPAFRGLDRRSAPGWLLLAMGRSGLFEGWSIHTATAVVWFYSGRGGALGYWPDGIAGRRRALPPATNTAIVGDNDRMYHRVEAIGPPDCQRSVPREALLHHKRDDRWEIRVDNEVLGSYRYAELRVSLSWKAAVTLDPDQHTRSSEVRSTQAGDLSLAAALEVVSDELRARGAWELARHASTTPSSSRQSCVSTRGNIRSTILVTADATTPFTSGRPLHRPDESDRPSRGRSCREGIPGRVRVAAPVLYSRPAPWPRRLRTARR